MIEDDIDGQHDEFMRRQELDGHRERIAEALEAQGRAHAAADEMVKRMTKGAESACHTFVDLLAESSSTGKAIAVLFYAAMGDAKLRLAQKAVAALESIGGGG